MMSGWINDGWVDDEWVDGGWMSPQHAAEVQKLLSSWC